MFSFFKKKQIVDPNLRLPFSTDIHSHVLPGIDDGAPDIETSLQLLRGLYNLGIRETVATPHIIGDMFRNTPETIGAALTKLKQAAEEAAIDIKISAAAEYMIDDYFFNLIKQKSPLLTVKDKIILTEQPYSAPSEHLVEITFEMMTDGYKPIMAHPERYFYYHNDYEKFEYLKELGYTLQVNLLSLTGYYGKAVAKAAKHIMDNDLADFVGTDMHHDRHLFALQHYDSLKTINKYLERREFNVFPS
ncbi:histidinol phosphatase [Ferruginibacter lapsinanis]|uniref:tyrosine-protein phosphatase n=1 Tax=Ferruginibacter lapsinanis TaxID=563172 RepID=UPI001E3C6112|nr:CpsB/CapC family capsule biosynthesis tyrosine phosphatase [Ferruginibacter lapsinanis]UEG49444.1 histidinol phosphatase [Ferruginibacter lapsinanis]